MFEIELLNGVLEEVVLVVVVVVVVAVVVVVDVVDFVKVVVLLLAWLLFYEQFQVGALNLPFYLSLQSGLQQSQGIMVYHLL